MRSAVVTKLASLDATKASANTRTGRKSANFGACVLAVSLAMPSATAVKRFSPNSTPGRLPGRRGTTMGTVTLSGSLSLASFGLASPNRPAPADSVRSAFTPAGSLPPAPWKITVSSPSAIDLAAICASVRQVPGWPSFIACAVVSVNSWNSSTKGLV